MKVQKWLKVTLVSLAVASVVSTRAILAHASSKHGPAPGGLPRMVADLENVVENIAEHSNKQDREITVLQQTETRQQSIIQSLQSTATSQAAMLATLDQEVTSLQSTSDSQGSDITSLKQQVVSLDSTTATQSGQIQQIQQGITQLSANDSNYAQQISSIQSTISRLSQELSSLQSGLGNGSSGSTGTGGFSVTGAVYDANGIPIETPISLYPPSDPGAYYSAWSGPETGTFTLTNVPNGTYNVGVGISSAYHLATSSPSTVTVSGGNVTGLREQLAEPTYTVSGTATENGAPLAYQNVNIQTDTSLDGGYWGTTSADGQFSISGLVPGTYEILIGVDWSKSNPASTALATGTVSVSNGDISNLKIGN